MGREVLIVWAGRNQPGVWETLCGEYRRRVERWMPVRDIAVRTTRSTTPEERRKLEGRALLRALPEPCWVVALTSGGRMFSSDEVARHWRRRQDSWPHAVAFLIGSDVGLSAEVLAAARECWSLGPLTLPHQLARLVLYEQLYRAASIRAGIKYHRPPCC